MIATAVCFHAVAHRHGLCLAVAGRLLGDECRVVERGDAVVQHPAVAAWPDDCHVGLVMSARSSRATLGWLGVAVLYALQMHLVAVVAVPIVMIVAAVTFREARPVRGLHAWVIVAAAVLAIAPYAIAEVMTGGANTRAILGHLGSSTTGSPGDTGSATMSLAIATDPVRLLDALGLGVLPATIVGAAFAVVALRWLRTGPLFWLTACAAVGITGQALFFLWMSWPFAGYHHVTLLAPFYAVVPAGLFRRGLFGEAVPLRVACAVGGVVLALLIMAGPWIADRSAERTPWSYSRIRAALDALCAGIAVDTDEGPAFAAQLNPHTTACCAT